MGDGWYKFNDSHGANNSYNVGDGWELHCHNENFQGPASFQNQSTGEKHVISPGDALYAAGMLEFAKRYLNNT